jgi:hypothetical protein
VGAQKWPKNSQKQNKNLFSSCFGPFRPPQLDPRKYTKAGNGPIAEVKNKLFLGLFLVILRPFRKPQMDLKKVDKTPQVCRTYGQMIMSRFKNKFLTKSLGPLY